MTHTTTTTTDYDCILFVTLTRDDCTVTETTKVNGTGTGYTSTMTWPTKYHATIAYAQKLYGHGHHDESDRIRVAAYRALREGREID